MNGEFSTGLFLQLALGPVFFLVMQITLQRTPLDGFCSFAAVVLIFGMMMIISALGMTSGSVFLQDNPD
ncbi:MAG: hypothetical protein K9I59_02165 [Chlorobium sp.]|jgi:threonine/homoserine/homoserine lactone efflux protein|uniref:hypothetical protein n=1 Tax=Chlorobium sp. TaxID=1095 RepID=UPI001D1AFAB7|nr:hypothetical protein [Chlorobium sp.]MBN1278166.1 hypothetical protein [Chlorobiaceae bacterium]MCF8215659.1 hypothetical protein [Chlorobium sp.]MCF8270714.1 hypothetical protein [Chlorobium sp.]MCF8286868.1 hypothetical protein [Chlorobium sp.]MCF8290556.1 hypothetical protein [Chlorobium sp.]